jgi:hypothetical protein
LLADLEAEAFASREKPVKELAKLGGAAKPALRKAMAGPLSAEAQRHVERLLERLPDFSPERL